MFTKQFNSVGKYVLNVNNKGTRTNFINLGTNYLLRTGVNPLATAFSYLACIYISKLTITTTKRGRIFTQRPGLRQHNNVN